MFVIARNAKGRPTLQHELVDGTASMTICGLTMFGWSRAFQRERIVQLYCKKCLKGH